MAPRGIRTRRPLLPALLAAVLATEITGIAIARTMSSTGPAAAAAPPAITTGQPASGVTASPAGGTPTADAPADAGRDTTRQTSWLTTRMKAAAPQALIVAR